jgi:hypothetical protein
MVCPPFSLLRLFLKTLDPSTKRKQVLHLLALRARS